ncbi:MAG: creatininase family protein [Sphaerochaetaceae bacterium]|nr:creatininase family protein [Sphaerochaetaceae bacterium]
MIKQWAEFSSKELENVKTVVLPIGATEQHGSHLPVGTDHFLVNTVVEELLKKHKYDLDIGILPTINYGKSIEHLSFPGTISISAKTLLNLIYDVGYSLSCQHIDNLIILNGHGGNTGLVESVIFDLKKMYNINAFSISLGALYNTIGEKCSFPHSMHAGYVETSIMMYGYPKFKNLYEKLPQNSTQSKGYDFMKKLNCTSWGWQTEDISKDGFMGSPGKSSAKEGEKIIEKLVQIIFSHLKLIIEENI